MKSKLVVWGQKGDQKVLIAMSLRSKDSKIDVYTFSEDIATEELYKNLTQDWRNGSEVSFPEGFVLQEIELSASGSILPEGVTVDNADLINRAQTEWHFAVLSAKLSATYASELEAIKDKIEQVTAFSQPIWNELKSFWDKVQVQIRDKNIFVEHISDLKKSTNEAFDALKNKRKEMDKTFNESSHKVKDDFMNALKDIEEKISKGLSLHPLFEELKKLQSQFKTAMLNNSDKKNVWDKLDATFKAIKEKRYGSQGNNENPNSAKERLDSRLSGLLSAIGKMEKSIQFDKNDLDYQNKKIDGPGGQLEVQIRQAKVRMVEDRVQSKQVKLNDMLKTKEELEQRKIRMEKNEALREEKDGARKAAQDKIAAEIKAASESRSESNEDLEKAAHLIAEAKKAKQSTPQKESILDAIGAVLGESLEDAVDSFKAVASVVGDKLGDVMDDIKDKASEKFNEMSQAAEEMAAEADAHETDEMSAETHVGNAEEEQDIVLSNNSESSDIEPNHLVSDEPVSKEQSLIEIEEVPLVSASDDIDSKNDKDDETGGISDTEEKPEV